MHHVGVRACAHWLEGSGWRLSHALSKTCCLQGGQNTATCPILPATQHGTRAVTLVPCQHTPDIQLLTLQVLQDFVKVITPSAVPAETTPATLTWLRQLPSGAAGVTGRNGLTFATAASCSSISSAANSADRCVRADPARICPNAYRCVFVRLCVVEAALSVDIN